MLVVGLFVIAGVFWERGLRKYAQTAREEGASGGPVRVFDREHPNGFDVSNSLVPREEIRAGGPPRDGIPAIDHPKFIGTEKADFLKADDIVISVTHGTETRAYPLRVLVWHEIVNDQIADLAFAVTYCPLCGTAMVFNRVLNGQRLSFGVSGLLYQSDVLMYDRETESLWSQLAMKCVAGKQVNAPLEWLASEHLTWTAWKFRFPQGRVLSTETGHRRDYSRMPYEGYEESPSTLFPVPAHRKELDNKAWVLGTVVAGQPKAYPIEQLQHKKSIADEIGGTKIEVSYDPANRSPNVMNVADRKALPCVLVYWFAWQAFYPHTALWRQ